MNSTANDPDFISHIHEKLGDSFGYHFFKQIIKERQEEVSTKPGSLKTDLRYIVSTMRIERYYTSMDDASSKLLDEAQELLNNQDYFGFFKACGPTFIRGIRRAQEITAIFSFDYTDEDTALKFSSSVRRSAGYRKTRTTTIREENRVSPVTKNLRIRIIGYGLGLTQKVYLDKDGMAATEATALDEIGSETLVATTLEEYKKVMKFAFITMTKNKDSVHIGMVYGVEVVPWVENLAFQVFSGLQDEVVEVPLARSMIPIAYRRTDPTDTKFVNDEETRAAFRCKDIFLEIDMFGYCCTPDALFDHETQTYDPNDPQLRTCRPIRVLDKPFASDNMATNAEFVARLDRSVAYKINQMNALQRCVTAIRSYPERFDYHVLKPQDMVKNDFVLKAEFSVLEMKMALDPFNDFSVVTHMAKEFDEWMEMFYRPCLNAIYGANVGTTSDTDPSFFIAYPWHNHDECMHIACFGNSMKWDRELGTCTASVITGNIPSEASSYSYCAKTVNGQGNLVCKHDDKQLKKFNKKLANIWDQSFGRGNADYFMQQYCLPELTGDVIEKERQFELKMIKSRNMDEFPTVNVALHKPATQIGTTNGGVASRAVDGNKNKYWRYGGITHTGGRKNPWWEVDLTKEYTIDKIVVYSRMDSCCKHYNNNFKAVIVNKGQRYELGPFPNPGYETIIDVNDVKGEKVRIELTPSGNINLAEVEVYGRVPTLNKFVAQYYEYTAGSLGSTRLKDLTPYKTDEFLTIRFYDGTGEVMTSGRTNYIAARVTGTVYAPAQATELCVSSDDGSKGYLNDKLIVNNDGLHGTRKRCGKIDAASVTYNLEVEMFEHGGGASLIVEWKTSTGAYILVQPKQTY